MKSTNSFDKEIALAWLAGIVLNGLLLMTVDLPAKNQAARPVTSIKEVG